MTKLEIQTFPKQREFIEDESKYSLAVAGLGAAKTHSGCLKGYIKAVKYPGIRGCVTAPTYKVLNDATLKKYAEIFGEPTGFAKFVYGDSPMCRLSNGSEIIFRSTDKPDMLRGMEIGWFHMDEAALSSYYAYQILQGRLRQRNKDGDFYPLQGWLTTTPKGLNWIYSEFVLEKKQYTKVFQWSTRDNVFLPKEYVDTLPYTGKQREQELEGQFLNLSGECVFDIQRLNLILRNDCREPYETAEDGLVLMWKAPELGKRYIAGVDCSDEGGGGANVMVIMDWQTGDEVCEVYGDIASDIFSRLVFDWGNRYNNCLLGVERNGIGNGVIARLEDAHYKNLYTDHVGKSDHAGKHGWYTNASNRVTMLEEYKIAVHRGLTRIHNIKAIEEMMVFVNKQNGKWEHMDGCKDDRVMARAICWQMRSSSQGARSGIVSYARPATTYAT